MKKKKKTLFIRRVRKRSINKSYRYSSYNFTSRFNDFFFTQLIRNDNKHAKSIFKFLISFFSMNEAAILNLLKKFGIYNSFKLSKEVIKSYKSFYLNHKFCVRDKVYAINFKDFSIFKKLFFFKLKATSFNSYTIRSINVENKKKMTLYFSYRHLLSLPVRGQRTKTNAKIRKNYSII